MAVNFSGDNNQIELPLNMRHVDVPYMLDSEMQMNSGPIPQSHFNPKIDKVNSYISDIDIEKGNSEALNTTEEPIACSDDSFARAFQKEFCLQIGGRFMTLLMNNGLELLKFNSTDKYDTQANKSRKYKRSASFNSRRVVLLFSILSSIGTLILIYLTLRVRQISNNL